tara:strand:+ start:541 stop:1206 length:666 start_codon:yes stop_codon:yes gene_type:complete
MRPLDLKLLKNMIFKAKLLLYRRLRILVLTSFALNIAACSSDYLPSQAALEETLNIFGTQKVTCPATRILRDGESFLVTQEGATATDPRTIAQITTVKISCRLGYPEVEGRNPLTKFAVLTTDLEVSIVYLSNLGEEQAINGPLPYFIALVNRFGEITTKEVFQAETPLATQDTSRKARIIENIVVNIPIDDLYEAEGYEMVVGFQLSAEQIEILRKMQRK